MKKNVLLFSLLLVLIIGTTSSFANPNELHKLSQIASGELIVSNKAEVFSPTVSEEELKFLIRQDPMFIDYQKQNYYEAERSLDLSLTSYRNIFSSKCFISFNNIAFVSMPLHMQPNSYTCGPNSGYISIDGASCAGNISGTSVNEKVATLISQMGTNSSSGTNPWSVPNVLNLYVSNFNYSTKYGYSFSSQAAFNALLFNSLAYDRAPILLGRTAEFTYYSGHDTGHYVVVSRISYDTNTCNIMDGNNDSTYYGTRSVPLTEARAMVQDHIVNGSVAHGYIISY